MRTGHGNEEVRTAMSFWDGETCEYCQGEIVERRVTLHRKVRGRYVLVENVPAGVCRKCGTRYYAANVLKTVAETVRGRRKAKREVSVPVYSI
ncbi:MAG: YgiT-type zinc finger protein [Planctomycetes bacterium]|nr:YgiT-type zinc finger protein [Planctomycetota bacterium]MBM4078702.1 YgiT-type zinc finger protein [Planctomycetota bacterium]